MPDTEQEKKVETDRAQLPLILYNQFIRATKMIAALVGSSTL